MAKLMNRLLAKAKIKGFSEPKTYGIGPVGFRPGGDFVFPFEGVDKSPLHRLAELRIGLLQDHTKAISLQRDLINEYLAEITEFIKKKELGAEYENTKTALDGSLAVLIEYNRTLMGSLWNVTQNDFDALPEKRQVQLLEACHLGYGEVKQTEANCNEIVQELRKISMLKAGFSSEISSAEKVVEYPHILVGSLELLKSHVSGLKLPTDKPEINPA